ncbi:PilN family type IVB pilus formation outer membrane protein [Salmonella enterica subsp. enterica serovar Pomona]|uniref:PilN family type IVB pilus formation outer membrane protein n=1 Tax=Salmonella enterica I TaxID=59201 RepID=A0A615R5E2_SALET|nr:PilN family type IVB pilus formation outer membrane protein [Salmonella enterica]EBR9559795.1 PilN family type IVB pilus formation outer membrane protein [Salmonella enterica subsp. enterica serovar Pomona]ECW7871444.1 PilN family type IVB pilus formation outer membrane protein [Salmonella enterica subsp. enterica serovar Kingabwa]EDN4564201.1 PilN family type IVB pilus formation outer membrane protein [Salmonella enterica subsp. enterica serovar Mountpleasant]EDU3707254.1 PilN family type I
MNEVQKSAEDTGVKASSLIQQMGDNYPVVQFTNRQYINTSPLPKPKYAAPRQVVNCKVQYLTVKPQDIFELSQDLSEQCHIRFRVSPDASAYLGSVGTGGGVTQRLTDVPSPVINSGEMKPLAMFGAQANNNAAPAIVATRKITDIRYSGSLGRFLDLITGRLGISWKYENGEVIFYYLETKRFDIQPADAKYDLTGTVTSGLSNATGTDSGNGGGTSSSGVSGSGGSTMSSTVAMGNNLYKDLKETVQSMLTPGVGRLSLNATTGTLMITDVPEVVRRVGDYLDDENSTLSRQVILKVVTYTVNTDVSDMVGIDWNLVWKSLNGNYGIKLANTNSGVASDAISGGFNVLDTATGAAAQFAGSSFLLNALSKQAKVSDVKTSTIMTTNMAAAPVLVGQQTTYLKDVTTTAYATGDATVPSQSLTPGSVTTGTNITILPKILKDSDRLMLNMFMDISSLKQIRTITSDTQKIEAPDIDTRSLQQRVWLKPGQTLIMSGFEQNTDNSNRQGVGSPNNILFGGALSGAKTKQSFVITVTPYVR